MAHIPDGILSLPVITVTTTLAAGGLALGLRDLDELDIPKTALLAAAFFVASSVAVPLGPTSVHLLLGGLIGLLLGWKAFPAVFVGLLLQLLLFGFGGLTTLGADLLNMALPGTLLALLLRGLLLPGNRTRALIVGGICGGLSVLATTALVALDIGLSSPDYLPAARILALTALPLAGVEALVGAFVTAYLVAVKPDLVFGRDRLATDLAEPA